MRDLAPPNSPGPTSRPGTRAQSFRRQNTGDSSHSIAQSHGPKPSKSFRIQATREREAAKPKRYIEKFSVYAGLTWDILRNYLREKWPNEDFKEQRRGDFWVFETPELLTDKDKTSLTKLREMNAAEQDSQRDQRESQSPEP
ncbi:hypothetical protein F4677DRAFT_438913 [Hypoxylon crocopeplum]|nr:hypothetical protein F4677DRAFT_438913 [Hypoxylon crocopeplum]